MAVVDRIQAEMCPYRGKYHDGGDWIMLCMYSMAWNATIGILLFLFFVFYPMVGGGRGMGK